MRIYSKLKWTRADTGGVFAVAAGVLAGREREREAIIASFRSNNEQYTYRYIHS